MPIGYYKCGEDLLNIINKKNPKSIMELGVGSGFWGAFMRNYGPRDEKGGFAGRSIAGIEIHAAYENPMWELYNSVIVGSIEDHLDTFEGWDLTVAVDVLEHLPRELGKKILALPNVFVGICNDMDTGVAYGNEHERHITEWLPAQVKTLGLNVKSYNPKYFAAWR